MKGQRLQLAGKTFGFYKVLRLAGIGTDRRSLWECRCVCGALTTIRGSSLVEGDVRSCGCRRRVLDGLSRTPAYEAWKRVRRRAKRDGQKLCKAWAKSPEGTLHFMRWYDRHVPAGNTHQRTLILIDPDKPYSPRNCTFIGIEAPKR